MMRIKTMIAAAAIAVTSTASADMTAVIYDMGSKFDNPSMKAFITV